MAFHHIGSTGGESVAGAVRGGTPAASGRAVTLGGERAVSVHDVRSVLLQAQEEVGMMRAGAASLRTRRPRAGTDSRGGDRQLAASYLDGQGAADLFEGGTADRFLDRLRATLRQGRGRSDAERDVAESLETSLDECAPDAPEHDRFALLIQARDRLPEEGGEETTILLAVLENALESRSRERCSALRAGFNVDPQARENASLDRRETLIAFYLEHVVGESEMTVLFRSVTEDYGRERFDETMRFLLAAAAADMASIAPSREPMALKNVVDSIYRLHSLASMDEQCATAIARLERWRLESVDGHDMLSLLLEVKEKSWLQTNDVLQGGLRLVRDSPQSCVAFCHQFVGLVEQLPEKAFEGEREKRGLLSVVREARDEAVLDEEGEEEGEAGDEPFATADLDESRREGRGEHTAAGSA